MQTFLYAKRNYSWLVASLGFSPVSDTFRLNLYSEGTFFTLLTGFMQKLLLVRFCFGLYPHVKVINVFFIISSYSVLAVTALAIDRSDK